MIYGQYNLSWKLMMGILKAIQAFCLKPRCYFPINQYDLETRVDNENQI